MKEKIGFIGTGAMGKPMALNLLKAGYPVLAYDITPKPLEELKGKGAAIGKSCKDVASQSDVIITMLPNSGDVEKAILGGNGVLEGAKSNSIVIDMSTIDPSVSRKVAQALSQKNIKMLDAPVSGGQMGAVAGNLAIMVGGDEDIFQKCLPIFQAMGKKIFHCGKNGSGGIVKIMNNLLAAITGLAAAEALTLGVKAGVNLKVLCDAINASSGQNWGMQNYFPMKAFKGDFEPGFAAALMYKDIGLAMNLAKEEGVPLLIGGLGHQIYSKVVASGLGQKDTSITIKILEDLANVKLRL
jgi:3-hydroxyisobutyrate dehydrogenase